jgi:hypothetical protein
LFTLIAADKSISDAAAFMNNAGKTRNENLIISKYCIARRSPIPPRQTL